MDEKEDIRSGSHPKTFITLCRGISAESVDIVVKKLKEDGADQKVIDDILSDSLPKIEEVLHSSYSLLLEAALREKNQLEAEKLRKDFLGRFVIAQIKDLLPTERNWEMTEKSSSEFVEGLIPRPVIPGLLSAVKDMFGQDYIEDKEKICRGVAKSYTIGGTIRIDWEKAYLDPRIIEVIGDMFLVVKKKLEEEEGVKDWFMKRISSSDTYKEQMSRPFEEQDFQQLIKAMFRIALNSFLLNVHKGK